MGGFRNRCDYAHYKLIHRCEEFSSYPLAGLTNLEAEAVPIPARRPYLDEMRCVQQFPRVADRQGTRANLMTTRQRRDQVIVELPVVEGKGTLQRLFYEQPAACLDIVLRGHFGARVDRSSALRIVE